MTSQRLHDVIAAIYDAALDEAAWISALELTANLLGGARSTVYFDDGKEYNPEMPGVSNFGELGLAYRSNYFKLDPIRPVLLTARSGVYTDDMLVDKREFLSSEFYNDYRCRYDMHRILHGRVLQDASVGLVNVIRSAGQREFEQEQVGALSELLPHIDRAMRVQQHLQAATITATCAMGALDSVPHSVFLMARNGTIIAANRAAEALLRAADGLRADAKGLCAPTPAATASLRRLVARAAAAFGDEASGGSMLLARASGRRPLSVVVTPLRPATAPAWVRYTGPAALVVVTDPDARQPSSEQLRQLFGLTPAEARLALQIASGGGAKAAARVLGVAPSTARFHLQHVFAKTGTARQAELAALLTTTLPPASGN